MPRSSHRLPARRLAFAVVLAVLAVSCGDETVTPRAAPATPDPAAAARAAAPAAAAAAANVPVGLGDEEVREYRPYSTADKRDPFNSYLTNVLRQARAGGGGGGGALAPNVAYEINSYQVGAIIFGVPNPTALIRVGENLRFHARQGELLGNKFGRIVQITQNCVIVAEEYTDQIDGRRIINRVNLCLPQEQVVRATGESGMDIFVDREQAEIGAAGAGGMQQEGVEDRLRRYQEMLQAPMRRRQELFGPSEGGGAGGAYPGMSAPGGGGGAPAPGGAPSSGGQPGGGGSWRPPEYL